MAWRTLPWAVRCRVVLWEWWLWLLLTIRRGVDVGAAILLLALASPLLLLTGLCSLVILGWPPLSFDLCCGEGGAVFRRWRFRVETEVLSALNPAAGPVAEPGMAGAWRRVRLAYSTFLRSLCLDRLPGLANLLLGDVALCGPPALPYVDVLLAEAAAVPVRWTRPGLFRRAPPTGARTLVPRAVTPLWLVYVDSPGFGASAAAWLRAVPAVFLGWGGYAAALPAVELVAVPSGRWAWLWQAGDNLLRRLLGMGVALVVGLAQVVPFLLLYPLLRLAGRGTLAQVSVAGSNWHAVPVLQAQIPAEPGFLAGLFRACQLDKFPLLGEVFIGSLWFCGQKPWPLTDGQPLLELSAAYMPGVFYREPSGAEPGGKPLYPGCRDEDYATEKSTLTDLGIFLRLLVTRPLNFLAGE